MYLVCCLDCFKFRLNLNSLSPTQIVVCCCKLNNTRDCMSIYEDKLAHIQVVNYWHSIAQMYTSEDTLAHNLGAQSNNFELYFTGLFSSTRMWSFFNFSKLHHTNLYLSTKNNTKMRPLCFIHIFWPQQKKQKK